jgi:hypothetical protein
VPVAAKVNATDVVVLAPAEVEIVAVRGVTALLKFPALAENATVVAVCTYRDNTPSGRTVAVSVAAEKSAATMPILLATAVADLFVTAIADAETSPGKPPFNVAIPTLAGKSVFVPTETFAFALPIGARADDVEETEIVTSIPVIKLVTNVNGNLLKILFTIIFSFLSLVEMP